MLREKGEIAKHPKHAPAIPADLPVEGPSEATGSTITFGDFLLVDTLASGRSGPLFRAWQKSLRRWVTLRRPPHGATPTLNDAFLRSAGRAAMLEHAGILRTFEVGQHEGHPFAAAELLRGRTLEKALPVSTRRALEILAECATAMHYAHGHGVLHGHFTPRNVMLAESSDPSVHPRVVVLDFALPAAKDGPYTAPELAAPHGTRTVASDIYSLGAVLYRALSGRVPDAAPGDPAWALDLVAGVTPEMDAVVRRAMAHDPKERHASAHEFSVDLRNLIHQSLTSPPLPPGAAERRRRIALVAGAGVGLAAVALVIFLLTRGGAEPKPADTPTATKPDPAEQARPIVDQAKLKIQDSMRLRYKPGGSMAPYRAGLNEALGLIGQAITIHPKDTVARLEHARVCVLLGLDVEAEKACALAIAADPASPEPYLVRAEMLMRQAMRRADMHRSREMARRRLMPTTEPIPNLFGRDPAVSSLKDRAAADLTAALDRNLRPYESLLARARLALLEWDLVKAIETCDRLIAEHPGREEPFLLRGAVRLHRAIPQLGAVLTESDRNARIAQAAGEAAADFDDALGIRMLDPEAFIAAGDAYFEQATQDGWQQAEQRYRSALNLDPGLVEAHYQLGLVHERTRRWAGARAHYARCAELDPARAEWLHLRAHAALTAGDKTDLAVAARTLAERFPDDALTSVFVAISAIVSDDVQEAERALKGSAKPQDARVRHLRGITLDIMRGRSSESADCFAKALTAEPGLAYASELRAHALQLSDDLPAAIRVLKDLEKRTPREDALLGAVYLLHGDTAEAKEPLERAVAAPDPEPDTLANYGLACLLANDLEPAIEALRRARLEAREKSQHSNAAEAARLREFWHGVHVNLALALIAAGQSEEAVECAREAVQWRPQNKWAQLALSQALAAAGQTDAAAEAKKAAGDAEPMQGFVMLARRRLLRVTLTYGRPGWDTESRDRDYDLGTGREFQVLLK